LVTSFSERYPDAEAFRAICREQAGDRELKRVTDVETRTPFCVYNLRLYRQTFYGIRDVLGPLMRTGSVSVLPMQPADPQKSWVVEICPASTLKSKGLYVPYKGNLARPSAAAKGSKGPRGQGSQRPPVRAPESARAAKRSIVCSTEGRRAGRARILKDIEETEPLSITSAELRRSILDDAGGDALDSLIAAVATRRAAHDPGAATGKNPAYQYEGFVYV
jgi:hypothetical protein